MRVLRSECRKFANFCDLPNIYFILLISVWLTVVRWLGFVPYC